MRRRAGPALRQQRAWRIQRQTFGVGYDLLGVTYTAFVGVS